LKAAKKSLVPVKRSLLSENRGDREITDAYGLEDNRSSLPQLESRSLNDRSNLDDRAVALRSIKVEPLRSGNKSKLVIGSKN
jgi:hypothetical protein